MLKWSFCLDPSPLAVYTHSGDRQHKRVAFKVGHTLWLIPVFHISCDKKCHQTEMTRTLSFFFRTDLVRTNDPVSLTWRGAIKSSTWIIFHERAAAEWPEELPVYELIHLRSAKDDSDQSFIIDLVQPVNGFALAAGNAVERTGRFSALSIHLIVGVPNDMRVPWWQTIQVDSTCVCIGYDGWTWHGDNEQPIDYSAASRADGIFSSTGCAPAAQWIHPAGGKSASSCAYLSHPSCIVIAYGCSLIADCVHVRTIPSSGSRLLVISETAVSFRVFLHRHENGVVFFSIKDFPIRRWSCAHLFQFIHQSLVRTAEVCRLSKTSCFLRLTFSLWLQSRSIMIVRRFRGNLTQLIGISPGLMNSLVTLFQNKF